MTGQWRGLGSINHGAGLGWIPMIAVADDLRACVAVPSHYEVEAARRVSEGGKTST